MGAFSFGERTVELLPDARLPWPIIWPGVVEIARSEGCRLRAYRDIAGVWTVGWGETKGVTQNTEWTQPQADRRLCARLAEFRRDVLRELKHPATDHQLAAMISLAYNIGMGWQGVTKPRRARDGFRQSSVLRAHNRGDTLAAARAFALWNKARKDGVLQVVPGLTARRARETALYLTPDSVAAPLELLDEAQAGAAIDMPAAEAETRLPESPMAQSGAVSVATGALAVASSASGDVREIALGLGLDPLLIVGTLALVAGAVVIYWRARQRREGWA